MIIANCANGTIPYPCSPAEETFRDLSRLYVAMTRARQQLVISFCGEPSRFLSGQLERFSSERWRSYLISEDPVVEVAPPRRLEQLRHDVPGRDYLEMTGDEYLYQEHAIGCPAILIEKLRSLITGRSRVISGNPTEWKTIGQALRDTSSNVRSRQVFGPEGYRLFRQRFDLKAEPGN